MTRKANWKFIFFRETISILIDAYILAFFSAGTHTIYNRLCQLSSLIE